MSSVPDYRLDQTAYSRWLRAKFHRLMRKSRDLMQLYYLVSLHGAWYDPQTCDRELLISDFEQTLIRWIRALMDTKTASGEKYKTHEMLFLFQLMMESKSFYSRVRNFVNIIRGQRIDPEPWLPDEWGGGGRVLSTNRLLHNLADELQSIGFGDLAAAFREAHLEPAMAIRNSIAHGTFYAPGEKTRGRWNFASYERNREGRAYLVSLELSHEEFVTVFGKVLAFRRELHEATIRQMNQFSDKRIFLQPPQHLIERGVLGFTCAKGNIMFACKMPASPPPPW